MAKTGSRPEAEKRFWEDVKELLRSSHGHSEQQAKEGINKYRQEVARRKLGEVVYNQGEEKAAKVIDGILSNDLPEPDSGSEKLSLEALLAAKKLADQIGGVEAAKQAMEALGKLS